MKGLLFIGRPNPLMNKIGHDLLVKSQILVNKSQVATIKHIPPPIEFGPIEWPEQRKLTATPKTPQFRAYEKARTMPKMHILTRGPEILHNYLIYKQYGIQAVTGGKMKAAHFEFLRLALNKLDYSKAFAVWRVDQPWQAVSRKGIGKKMGGGKSPIHHYITPVRAGRIILEVGGELHPLEIKKKVAPLAENLPFPARFVTHEMLEEEKIDKKIKQETNLNPYTMKYVILNNMHGCNNWLSPYDYEWFGEYR